MAKGVRGADCLLVVRNNLAQLCGKIIYESKRTKAFTNEWIEKLKADIHKLGVLDEAHKVREDIGSIGKSLAKLCNRLEKDPNFPDLEDFLVK